MSHQYYNLQWKEGINQLMDIIQVENQPREQNEEKLGITYKRTDYEWFQHFAILYIKYVQCYKILENSYDQLAHPQKRLELKEMLDLVIIRLVECYQELVRFNTHHNQVRCEFINLEDILQDLKLSPNILEIRIPRYFLQQEQEDRDKRNQMIDKLLQQFHDTCEPEEEVIQDRSRLDANLETAIRIIQKNERGRQAIEKCILIKYKIKEKEKEDERKLRMRLAQGQQEINDDTETNEAIIVIQKYFKGFKARQTIHNIRQEEAEFLGFKLKETKYPEGEDPVLIEKKERQKMREIQKQNQQEYEDGLEDIRELVKLNEGPDIKQNMLDQRREWLKDILAMYQFKKVPKIEEYYTRKEVMMPLTADQLEAKKAEEEQKAKDAKKNKDAKKAGKKGKKGKSSELDEFMEGKNILQPSENVLKLQQKIDTYDKEWSKKDESKNFCQKYENDLAKKIVTPGVNTEIEQLVDLMITVEIQNIKLEFGIKGKEKKKKKPKKKKAKKGKPIPGQKLVKNRDPRDMLAELVEAGIVKKLQPAKMDDLKGDANMLGCLQEMQSPFMPDPSIAQLRQYLTQFVALGLGNKNAKKAIPKSTWVMFYGPMGTGKSLALRAIATECDAMVIDLSVSNLEGNYMDKSSTNKMLYMAFTIAKEYQPSIIFMDDIDLVFPAKKPKRGAGQGPTRLKKPIQDFKKCKYVKEDDRVVFIGLTNKPADCNVKETRTFFERKIYFPFPNYSTRMMLFQHYIAQKQITLPDTFPISSIAHITEGYTGRSFEMAINQVLTSMRIKKLNERPLTFNEFIGPLSNNFCTFAQEYEKIRQFTDDVTELKQRRDKKNNPNKDEDNAKKDTKKGKKK